jgi:acetyl esterase/lipase
LVLALLCAAACGVGVGSGGAPAAAATPAGAPAGSQAPPALRPGASQVLTYCNGQQMLVSLPRQAGPRPVMVFVHGGDWEGGNYADQGWVQELRPALNRAGFVVAGVDYRLAPAHKWPDQLQDVTCAIRYLRAWSSRLHVDPRRIGGWGDSAGGQLLGLVAVAPHLPGAEVGPYRRQSDTLRAVVDMYGIVDLSQELTYLEHLTDGSYAATLEGQAIVGRVTLAQLAKLVVGGSPSHYVRRGDPPFMILQGTADTICPPAESLDFAAKLRAAGVPVDVVLVRGGQHGLISPGESPDAAQETPAIVAWATRWVAGHGRAPSG